MNHHHALQKQYEQLLSDKVNVDEVAMEERNDEEHYLQYHQVEHQLHTHMVTTQYYCKAIAIRRELQKMESVPNLSSKTFERSFRIYEERFSTLIEASVDEDSDKLLTVRNELEESVAHLLECMTVAHAKEKDADR